MRRNRGIGKVLIRRTLSVNGVRRLYSILIRHLSVEASKARTLKEGVEDSASNELSFLRNLISGHPFFSVSLALLLGTLMGGLLSARISQYVLFSLVGGFPISIFYGSILGIPPEVSVIFVIFLDLLLVYVSLKLLYVLSRYPKFAPYFEAGRNRYKSKIEFLIRLLNRLSMVPAIALISFLLNPWSTTIIAYMLLIDIKTTIKGIFIGLTGAGAVSLLLYNNLLGTIPNPFIVTAIILAVIFTTTAIINRVLKPKNNATLRS